MHTAWTGPPGVSIAPLVERVPRILVVDGPSAVSIQVAAALPRDVYELTVCALPARLIRQLTDLTPDLIFVDMGLTTPSALELCSELRATERGASTPIVLLSLAPADEQMVTRGLTCGADDVLSLADRLGELPARVRLQLRNKRERDRLSRVRNERDIYRRDAVRDALTGIPNRRCITGTIDRFITTQRTFALLFVDIDYFKSVNDTYGHNAGDAGLKLVASSLRDTLRPGDHCGRYGGEEFVVVVAEATVEIARAAAEAHRVNIEKLVVPGTDRKLSVSIGVAVFDPEHPDADCASLARRSDAALYEAKRQGRNRVVLAKAGETAGSAAHDGNGAPNAQEELERALLKELETGLAGLPLLPAAAAEALRLAENPATHIAHVAKLVDRDPPLAARFIALAGSAAYSRGRKAASMKGALVRIGLAAARDLLLQAVYERAVGEVCRYQAEIARSFSHAVRTAIATRCVMRQLHVAHEHAYLCGLLHNIGEARIYRILARMPSAPEPGELLDDLVRRHHTRAGADIARAWRLPAEIVEVCTHHHDDVDQVSREVQIVMAAEALARAAEATQGSAIPPVPSEADARVLASVGISAARYDALIMNVDYELRQSQLDAGEQEER